jgi:hypothetical protein
LGRFESAEDERRYFTEVGKLRKLVFLARKPAAG